MKVSSFSDDANNVLGWLCFALKEEGWTWEKIEGLIKKTPIKVSNTTLRQRVRDIKEDGEGISQRSNSGRKMSLLECEMHALFGAILCQDEKVDARWCMDFLEENFGKEVSWATLSRYLNIGGLSYQLTGTRNMKEDLSHVSYCKEYHEFLVKLQTKRFFKHKHEILCIDCCSNSRRIERLKTISVKGGKQKKLKGRSFKYTNCYLKCVSLHESGAYRALMFTYDPSFAPESQKWDTILDYCKEWGLESWQIVWEDPKKVKISQRFIMERSQAIMLTSRTYIEHS